MPFGRLYSASGGKGPEAPSPPFMVANCDKVQPSDGDAIVAATGMALDIDLMPITSCHHRVAKPLRRWIVVIAPERIAPGQSSGLETGVENPAMHKRCVDQRQNRCQRGVGDVQQAGVGPDTGIGGLCRDGVETQHRDGLPGDLLGLLYHVGTAVGGSNQQTMGTQQKCIGTGAAAEFEDGRTVRQQSGKPVCPYAFIKPRCLGIAMGFVGIEGQGGVVMGNDHRQTLSANQGSDDRKNHVPPFQSGAGPPALPAGGPSQVIPQSLKLRHARNRLGHRNHRHFSE